MVSMVSTAAFSRIKAPIACAIVVGGIFGWGMANIPDYGREIYNNTAPVDYDKYMDQTGFPAGNGYKELSNRADIIEAKENCVVSGESSVRQVGLYSVYLLGKKCTFCR